MADKRTEARRRGGENRATTKRLERLMPSRLVGVYGIVEETLGQVRTGGLTPQQGTAIAALARALVNILQAGELEERLRTVEQSLGAARRQA